MKIPNLSLKQNIMLCLMFSLIQIFIIYNTTVIYIPVAFTLIFSFFYGLVEPKKGWLLSTIQVGLLFAGLLAGKFLKIQKIDYNYVDFATYTSIFPSFVAAFIGSFIRRL